MSFDLNTLKSESIVNAPRIVCVGESGIGKTTFGASYEESNGNLIPTEATKSTLILQIGSEIGANAFACKKPICNTLDDVFGWLSALIDDPMGINKVVLDSKTSLEILIFDRVCKDQGWSSIQDPGYGKGPAESLVWWARITTVLDKLMALGIASVITGHIKSKEHSEPGGSSYSRWEVPVAEKTMIHLHAWADFVFYAAKETIVKTEKGPFGKETKVGKQISNQRWMYTDCRPHHPGKSRGFILPYKLPFSWAAFTQAIAESAQTK